MFCEVIDLQTDKMNKVRTNSNNEQDKRELESSINKNKTDPQWTREHKETFLEALKKYGHKDIPAISKMMPDVPVQVIKTKISEYSALSIHLYEDELINNWLSCGLYKPGDSPMSEALLFLALFEEHPEIEGYDFKAVYNFLYHASLKTPTFLKLPEKSRKMLCSLVSKVDKDLWPKFERDLWDYIGRVYKRRNISKVYSAKKVSST